MNASAPSGAAEDGIAALAVASTDGPDVAVTAIARLHRAEYSSLVRMAALMANSRSLAEEIVQDVFVELLRRAVPLDPGTAVHYLRRAVANRTRSALRSRALGRVLVPAPIRTAPSAEDRVLAAAGLDVVLAGVAGLPLRQRQVLVLRYFVDASINETAAVLGISPAAVTSSTHRALRALSHLKEELK